MKIFFTCVLSIFIVSVFCEGVIPQGEGTIESPFLIETLDNLRYISENSNMWLDFYYLQTADIDASSSINWNSGAGFKPLGEAFQVINFDENGDIYYDDCLTPFDSYYDGGGFSISGLYITSDGSNSDFIAFVSNQTYGTLDNINLIDVNVSGFKYVGGLVAYTESTINNCSVSGNVNAVGSFAGGLAAVCDGGMIANSSFSGSVHASSDASLLVVQCSSDINNCDVSGTLTADSKASGLVCYRSDSAEISDCSVDIYMNIIPTDVNYGIFDFNHNSKYLHKENYTNIKNTFYNSNSRINNEEQNLFGKLTNAEFQEWLANDKVFDPDNYFQSSSNSYLISSEEEFKNLKYFYSRNDLNFMLNSDITFGTETSSVIPLFNGHLMETIILSQI